MNIIHGAALVLDNNRRHSGVYFEDISAYVLGYIVGSETSAKAISLTNNRFPDKTSFRGRYYAVENSAAFDCFIAETLDYLCGYEIDRYGTISLYSPEYEIIVINDGSKDSTAEKVISYYDLKQTDASIRYIVPCKKPKSVLGYSNPASAPMLPLFYRTALHNNTVG